MPPSPIFCAIDIADAGAAFALARTIAPHVGGLKLGLEYFIANGPDGVRRMAGLGAPIFLDLKLHDIPNTVAGAVKSAASLGVDFLTIHTSGGREMMARAVDATAGKVKLLGVSVLTSLSASDLQDVGQATPVAEQVKRLTLLATSAGLDGLVCSPHEIVTVRQACGNDLVLMVPGIRPAGADMQDQKRAMTPEAAMQAGANYLVIGRPITGAPNPAEAAHKLNHFIPEWAKPEAPG